LTELSKINDKGLKKPRILLAPLDWGLGHATRCIPVIKELLRLKCEVIIAASGDQKALLIEEFPLLPFADLPGYGIKYGKNRALTFLKIITLIPKILIRIKQERGWLKRFMQKEPLDAVISDCRFGLYNKELYSVFMTHQLRIRTSFGAAADRCLQRIQYRMLRHFDLCWAPDTPAPSTSLAGALSHPKHLPSIPVRYIGPLSRFEKGSSTMPDGSAPPVCDLLILLSGPEPQRSIFENAILEQLIAYKGTTILIRGLPGRSTGGTPATGRPGASDLSATHPHLTIHSHLPAAALNAIVAKAALILARPGYSSVMDLMKLGKKCIFVPTPGQTEQEYLGPYLAGQHLALCVAQKGFSLSGAIAAAAHFPFARSLSRMEESDPLTEGTLLKDSGPLKEGEPLNENGLLKKEIEKMIHSFFG
jgi:hypothetical protein